jgi:hypothetical protein
VGAAGHTESWTRPEEPAEPVVEADRPGSMRTESWVPAALTLAERGWALWGRPRWVQSGH